MSKTLNDLALLYETFLSCYNQSNNHLGVIVGGGLGILATTSFIIYAPSALVIPALFYGAFNELFNFNEYENIFDFMCGATLQGILVPTYLFNLCSFALTGLVSDVITEYSTVDEQNSSDHSYGDILLATQEVQIMHNDI